MKILHFYRVLLPSPRADAVQVVNTGTGMARAGADVTLHVETLSTDSVTACLAAYGIADPVKGGGGAFDIRAIGRHWSWPFLHLATRGLFRGHAGEVLLYVREVRPYVPGLMRRAREAGVKTIFEAHNVSSSLVKERAARSGGAEATRLLKRAIARERLEADCLALADGLVCTQRRSLDLLSPLLRHGAPCIVAANGAPSPPALPETPRDLDILYCGSLKAWKGVDGLVAAMAHVPKGVLTIVGPAGPGDVERIAGAARAHGVSNRVTVLPPVEPGEVWSLYARARVGVIPLPGRDFIEAREFTSPLKLFEMLAAGLPVVATRLASIEEYVADGREALLVEPDDPVALGSGIARLLSDEALRESLGEAARRRAEQYTWDARGETIVSFARQVLGH